MKIGGNVSYKLIVAPYETMEVSSSIELELSGDFTEEELKAKQNQITASLKEDVNKKAKEMIANYHEKIKGLKKVWES